MTEKHLWEYDHPYYASEGCYWTPGTRYHEVHTDWDSWAEFMAAWGDTDPDLNLVYRWDWVRPDPAYYKYEIEEDPEFEIPGDYLKVYFVLQRKANLHSHHIQVTEADEAAVREWLQTRAERVRMIWEPLLDAVSHPKGGNEK